MSKKWQNVSRQGKLDYRKRSAKGTGRRDRPVHLLPAESRRLRHSTGWTDMDKGEGCE